MALQKKKYRSSTNRSRGGGLVSMSTERTKKDYGRNVRAFHGAKADEVQTALAKQIEQKKKFG